jgi:hypothetical protein
MVGFFTLSNNSRNIQDIDPFEKNHQVVKQSSKAFLDK